MPVDERREYLELRFDVESAFALADLTGELPTEKNWARWINEALAAVSAVCTVLDRQEVSATFFVLGLLLERAGGELASLLAANPRYDIGSHTYTHMQIWRPDHKVPLDKVRAELSMTSDLIVQYFGSRPIGFCAPGNFYQGLRSKKEQLELLWQQGYRYVGTDGQDQRSHVLPAPFTQPYWYDDEGFPDMLELPLTGWHCNMLFNSGHQNDNWQPYRWHPAPGFPDGTALVNLPKTVEEGFRARQKEFRYAIQNKLVYAPCMHPWSVCRFDPKLEHLERLIGMAKMENVPVVNCRQLYELFNEKEVPQERGSRPDGNA